MARSTMLSKRENKINVSRTSLVLSGSRTRSVLGGSGLGGDDLDVGADKLLASTMGAFFAGVGVLSCRCWDVISSVLQAVRSHRCWGATRPMRSGVGVGTGCGELMLLVQSPCCFSLSSIFLGCNSFEGKIEHDIMLCPKCLILWSTRNTNSV